MVVTRSEREITAHMTQGTCRTRQGTSTAYRLHTREGGDTNPFPEGNNTEHKAHRLLDKGKETPRERPRARHMITTKHIANKGKRRKDPAAAPHGEWETITRRTHKTYQSMTHRHHTWEGGDIDPFSEGKKNENTSHRMQDTGKGIPRKDPSAR